MGRIITQKHLKELLRICPEGVKTDISLAEISSWRIGGSADCIVEPSDSEQLKNIVMYTKENKIPVMAFGATSNLLFADEGLRALAVKIGSGFSKVEISGNTVTAEAGIWTPLLARKIAQAGLSGAEHIVGIPGTLGGLVFMNGGSSRKCIGENVVSVSYVSSEGEIKTLNKFNCYFSYRSSIFKKMANAIIYKINLEFEKRGSAREIRNEMLFILRSRRSKFPRKTPNCGSVFTSNPIMYEEIGPPGLVIEQCGLKGKKIGCALVSPKHANFILNTGGATAKDVLMLVRYIIDVVHANTGFILQTEFLAVDEKGNRIYVM